ncbi:hypothetical protein SAMN05428976_1149 [Clostridium sp. USBA 49]|nr:hypothetical protein SAMN05428976_1149 [Clostridium sp. USBA 49]
MKFKSWNFNLILAIIFLFIALTRFLVKDTIGVIIFIFIAILFFITSFTNNKIQK